MSQVTLSSKFQVLIPQEVRASLKLRPGQAFQVFHEDGQIVFVPIQPMHKMRGFIKGIATNVLRDKDRV